LKGAPLSNLVAHYDPKQQTEHLVVNLGTTGKVTGVKNKRRRNC